MARRAIQPNDWYQQGYVGWSIFICRNDNKANDMYPLYLFLDHEKPFLHGETAFGDNIQDEWFVVWLLMQITASFENVTARQV